MPVYDKLGREITADRIIAGAREYGYRLERGAYLRPDVKCGCADGILALTIDPGLAESGRSVLCFLDDYLADEQAFGLSDGFELDDGPGDDAEEWGNPESYLACYAIGREVYARRHEAEWSAPEEPTR